MSKDIEEIVATIDVVTPKFKGLIERKKIAQLIKDYVKHDRFKILRPNKSNKYITYWAAITFYDTKLSEALLISPNKWYKLVCDEIKEYLNKKTLSHSEIARYYKENF